MVDWTWYRRMNVESISAGALRATRCWRVTVSQTVEPYWCTARSSGTLPCDSSARYRVNCSCMSVSESSRLSCGCPVANGA